MDYEIITLEEKTLVGIGEKASNDDQKSDENIGEFWTRIFKEDIYNKIQNKVNSFPICLYSDYTDSNVDDNKLEYNVTIGFEVSNNTNSEYIEKIIPSGKYAKFSITGDVSMAVMNAWQKIWELDLNRSYTGDFEEYLNQSMDNAEINIYVALK